MGDPEPRKRQNPFLSHWRKKQSFIGNDDDTDNPDFDKGSWPATVFVLLLIGLAIVFIFKFGK